MQLSRREFIASTSWALLAGTPAARAAAATSAGDWASVQAQFNLAPALLHFSQFYIVSHPKPVRDAIEAHRRRLDENPFIAVERGMFESEAENQPLRVQAAAASYLGAKPDEIALVDSTTQGLALIYNGLPLAPGHEVLLTTHDHYVHHEAARLAAAKLGARVRRVELYAKPSAVTEAEVTANLKRAIAKGTRVVGLTWVHSSTGVKLPIRALAAVIAEANRKRVDKDRILLVVDGVHGFGNQDESPVDMGCDYFAAGTHKWIFAPRGTGIVWARAESWARLAPTIPTFMDFDAFNAWAEQRAPTPTRASTFSPGGFKPYEHQWAMAEAFAFHQQLGRKRVADRIAALNDQCKEGLGEMPHVTLHTPRGREQSAGIICFEVRGLTPQQVVAKMLEKKIVASNSPYKVTYARLAPSLVNDEQQVEQALRAVRDLG